MQSFFLWTVNRTFQKLPFHNLDSEIDDYRKVLPWRMFVSIDKVTTVSLADCKAFIAALAPMLK